MKYSVMVVDDDNLVNDFVFETLSRLGYKCRAVFSGEEARNEIGQRPYDIVLLDLKMKGIDGIETLRQIKNVSPDTQVLMMTAYGTVETAVKAMKLGATDFLLKPVSPETLEHKIAQITEMMKLRSENIQMKYGCKS